jgi:hypothetical protein
MAQLLCEISRPAGLPLHRLPIFRRTDEGRAENPVLQGNRMQSVVTVDDSTIEVRLINWGRCQVRCRAAKRKHESISNSHEAGSQRHKAKGFD